MLLKGEYKGIQLYYDYPQSYYPGWKASKRNCFRLWSNNFDVMTINDWEELFDNIGCNHSINKWSKKESWVAFQENKKLSAYYVYS